MISVTCSALSEIVVIDIDKVITNSIAYKKFKVDWEKNNLKYQNEIANYEKRMMDLDKEIRLQSDNISAKELNKLKTQLSEHEIMIQKLVEKRKNMLDTSFSNAIAQIKNHLMRLVEKNAAENNIEIVVSKSQTIYTDAKHDITDNILQNLNKELKYIDSSTGGSE